MLLEILTVSRKTARDGRLEITDLTARRLAALGDSLQIVVGDARDTAILSAIACTCAKGAASSAGHQHHFVGAELLKSLPAEQTAVLELTEGKELHIVLPHAF